jgi:hypothetical protein
VFAGTVCSLLGWPALTSDAGPAITRYDFASGALRGTHFTLYATCLTHRGENHLETLPLAAIASLRVAYERNARRIGWGVALLVVALILFAVSGPIAGFAAVHGAEMAKTEPNAVTRVLQGAFGFLVQLRGRCHSSASSSLSAGSRSPPWAGSAAPRWCSISPARCASIRCAGAIRGCSIFPRRSASG